MVPPDGTAILPAHGFNQSVAQGTLEIMHLNYCRSIRHHIKVGDRELRVTACPNGSLALSELSAESGLHLGMPCELQKNPARRDRRGLPDLSYRQRIDSRFTTRESTQSCLRQLARGRLCIFPRYCLNDRPPTFALPLTQISENAPINLVNWHTDALLLDSAFSRSSRRAIA